MSNSGAVERYLPADTHLKREMPLIPTDSVAGRALVVVISIMTFLACLTADGALLIAQASEGWRSEVSREVTIQIKPKSGEDIDAVVAKVAEVAAHAPGVVKARGLSKAESEHILEPWLGQGVDLSQLPIPRLIVVEMNARNRSDLAPLKAALAAAAPEASLDDHRFWLSRLDTMAEVIVLFAAALFALMIVAMATAVGFATRGAMAGNREIIEVLHFVGAADGFIARQFQAHFFRLGLRGAAIGGFAAGGFLAGASLLSRWWARSAGGDEIAALFGTFAPTGAGYLAILIICGAIAGLTGLLSRFIALGQLRSLS
jgi:cell division transport system permease protein